MPGPAARLGDQTAHGGVITLGFPQVLIGGQPAARLTDMHTCPMATPGTPPIPHVGGPVSGPGVATVLIGNMPAATMGDMAVCVGPPDVIVKGCPTVILGMAGAGAGSAGMVAGGGAAAAAASVLSAQFDNKESVTKEEHWVEFAFVDKAGLPVSGVSYTFTGPDNRASEGVLRLDGRIRRDALGQEGSCKVVLKSVSRAQWSKDVAKPGDQVKLSAAVEGFDAGTAAVFQVWVRDVRGMDRMVAQRDASTQSDKVEADWTYTFDAEGTEVLVPDEGASGREAVASSYSAPQYYFDVIVGPCQARSGLLGYGDFIELDVTDEDGQPLADEPYVLYLSSGEVRTGSLDGNGHLKEENIPPGLHSLRFPNLPDFEVEF